jgi:TonB family protein
MRLVPPLLLTLCLGMIFQVTFHSQSVAAQTPMPELPKEPGEIFSAAAPFYDFSASTLKPWHFKVSYQLYDEDSKAAAKGTYEYWWAAPDTYRSTWIRPGMEQTDWHVQGKHFHAGTGPSLDFIERKLQSDLLTPLPRREDLDPKKVRLQRDEQKIGAVKLPCVMVMPKLPQNGHPEQVPSGEFPTFCFDPAHPILLAYYAFGSTTIGYNKITRVQGIVLPRDLTVFEGGRKALTATVDDVGAIASTAPELVPVTEAKDEDAPKPVETTSGVTTGLLLKKVNPSYPVQDKQNRIQGKVVLRALIGKDGNVHDLTVEEEPSPTLVGAALVAVSQWKYRPYMLNGEPMDISTTINVIFNLGG